MRALTSNNRREASTWTFLEWLDIFSDATNIIITLTVSVSAVPAPQLAPSRPQSPPIPPPADPPGSSGGSPHWTPRKISRDPPRDPHGEPPGDTPGDTPGSGLGDCLLICFGDDLGGHIKMMWGAVSGRPPKPSVSCLQSVPTNIPPPPKVS